jgi:hypothetical protein
VHSHSSNVLEKNEAKTIRMSKLIYPTQLRPLSESIPVLSSGFSFTLFIPSAFVTFPSSSLSALTALARLRIISAGPFHNIILWVLLITAGRLGLGNVLGSVAGYGDISALGRIVINVDPVGIVHMEGRLISIGCNQESPLYDHLPPGSLVTKLDDAALVSSNNLSDSWTYYLTTIESSHEDESMGWCVERTWYLGRPNQKNPYVLTEVDRRTFIRKPPILLHFTLPLIPTLMFQYPWFAILNALSRPHINSQ